MILSVKFTQVRCDLFRKRTNTLSVLLIPPWASFVCLFICLIFMPHLAGGSLERGEFK